MGNTGRPNEDRKVSSCPPNFGRAHFVTWLACPARSFFQEPLTFCDDQKSKIRLARQTLSIDLIVASSRPQVQRRLGKPTVPSSAGRHPSLQRVLCVEEDGFSSARGMYSTSVDERSRRRGTGCCEGLGGGRALWIRTGSSLPTTCAEGFCASIRSFSLSQVCSPKLRSLV